MLFFKKGSLFYFFLFFFSLAMVSAFSSSNLGNSSSSLLETYSPGNNLAGWINLSISHEDFNSLISASFFPAFNGGNITLFNLLKNNSNLNYSCSTLKCNFHYASLGDSQNSLIFYLDANQIKLLGIKIQTNNSLPGIENFSFKINSNSVKSCINPLKISFFPELDHSLTWTVSKSSGNFECNPELKYGNFESIYSESTPAAITSSKFCNRINLSEFPDLKIGASFIGSGNANFTMSLSGISSSFEKSCNVEVSNAGEFGCIINSSTNEPGEYYVCLAKTNGADYQINFERHLATGYWENEDEENKYDWQIFAQPASYAALGEINLSPAIMPELTSEIYSYLQENYGENINCSLGCIIPVGVYSNINNQQIEFSELSLRYHSGPAVLSETKFYNISQIPSVVTLPFSKIYFNNSGLRVPQISGLYNLTLNFGGYAILKKPIEVLSIPIVNGLYPTQVPAAVDTLFTVSASGNITRYLWDFGDNVSFETSVNFATHKYANLSNYPLTITLFNALGQSTQNFSINVISPKEYLNFTLGEYKKNVINLKNQITGFPDLVKSYLDGYFNLTSWELKLSELQVAYASAGNDFQKYIEIANSLSKLTLPSSINITETTSGRFLFNPQLVSPANLANITSETFNATLEVMKNATFAWFVDSFNVVADEVVYSTVNFNSTTPLATFVTFTLAPKKDISGVYLMINRPSELIRLADSARLIPFSGGVALPLDFSTGQKELSILFLEKIAFFDMPVYLTPKLSDLSVISSYSCNFNSICESGETTQNCSNDCKPWKIAWFWIIVVLVIIFCLYILAQEWYKRRYENFLFKDKNDVYNLTHFMDNAEKQGLSKDEIFTKLIEKTWNNEQVVYAYKKYHGFRTGMFEIPIFKIFEMNKIKKEIELRGKAGINPNVAPRPTRPVFIPAVNSRINVAGFKANNLNNSNNTQDNRQVDKNNQKINNFKKQSINKP